MDECGRVGSAECPVNLESRGSAVGDTDLQPVVAIELVNRSTELRLCEYEQSLIPGQPGDHVLP